MQCKVEICSSRLGADFPRPLTIENSNVRSYVINLLLFKLNFISTQVSIR